MLSLLSKRLDASYGQDFAGSDTGTLLFPETIIYLDYTFYNGNGQSLWLYTSIYSPNPGLAIAIVAWEHRESTKGAAGAS